MEEKIKEVLFEGGNNSENIIEQFLSSDYHTSNQLNMDRFLDEDKTIDLEKLELAIIILIDYLEKSIKSAEPIYINIGNMEQYVSVRQLSDLDKVIEESSFIIGFCQAIAAENKIDRDVIVRFRGKNGV